MIVLSLTGEDRDLLLLLSAEQRDSVLLSLLTGEEAISDKSAETVYKQIKKRERAREMSRRTSKRHRDSHRDCHDDVTVTITPPSPPSPPFLPPSPFPPEPPLSSPPYNPPSPSPTPRRTGARSQEDFDLFWSAYPKKVGKKSAKKAFDKVQVPVETLVTAIRRQECSAQWSKDGGQFIPNPSTWLNQERWEDELDPIPGQEQSPVPPPKKYETRLIDGEWIAVEVEE